MRTTISISILVLCSAATPAFAQQQGDPPTCMGEEATIVGTEGNDRIDVGGGPEVVWAGDGNDEIYLDIDAGYSRGHIVCAGPGNDLVIGSDNEDAIFGGAGNDDLVGDEIEQANIAGTNDLLDGGPGDDTLNGGAGADTIHPGRDDDTIERSPGADTLSYEGASLPIRAEGDGQLGGSSGTVTGLGTDTFENISTVIGGNNNDHITGIHRMVGGPGGDVLRGTATGSEFYGGPGRDRMFGNDTATPSRDVVNFEHSAEGVVVNLRKGRAWGEGHDRLFDMENVVGTPFDDVLLGTDRQNRLYGLAGDDELRGRKAQDNIYGGSGADLIRTGEGNDQVQAGRGHDVVLGNDGPTIVYGGRGHDVMRGRRGHDQLYGERGSDRAFGGRGRDICDAEREKSCERERGNW